jgi:hypothetical protein
MGRAHPAVCGPVNTFEYLVSGIVRHPVTAVDQRNGRRAVPGGEETARPERPAPWGMMPSLTPDRFDHRGVGSAGY